jgi:heptosyltransferase-2
MKILLQQTAFLGDIVLSTPVIAALKRLYPDAELSVLTTPLGAHILAHDPRITQCIVDDKKSSHRSLTGFLALAKLLRQQRFDRVYALHKSWRTALLLALAKIPLRVGFRTAKLSWLYHEIRERPIEAHDVIRNLSLVEGSDPQRDSLSLYPEPHASAHTIAMPASDVPYIVIAPGSAWKTKRWSATRYRSLVASLSTQITVFLLGAPQEHDLAEFVRDNNEKVFNLCGKLSLPQMFSWVAGARAVVCNDSLLLHVASSFQRPTVALFCATSPSFGFGPWQTPHRILESKTLACRPCRRHGASYCPTGTERCRSDIGSNEVIDALRELACLP